MVTPARGTSAWPIRDSVRPRGSLLRVLLIPFLYFRYVVCRDMPLNCCSVYEATIISHGIQRTYESMAGLRKAYLSSVSNIYADSNPYLKRHIARFTTTLYSCSVHEARIRLHLIQRTFSSTAGSRKENFSWVSNDDPSRPESST